MPATRPDPTPLLSARSIAVVGATERPGSYGDTIVRNLETSGFGGTVYAVNPGRQDVHGLPCYPTVLDLPEPVDAVAVAVPAAGVPDVIARSVERGCGGAIVVSAGFGEVGSGRGFETELRETALANGFPVCGPNGNGVVSVGSGRIGLGRLPAGPPCRTRGDDFAVRQRRRQRGRIETRDRVPHGRLYRQPGGDRHRRVARCDRPTRRGAVGCALHGERR